MDNIVDFSNLLLLASLSSCVSAAADGIYITGQVADSPMACEKTEEVGEIWDIVSPIMMPMVAANASAAGGEADVPPLVHGEAAGSGAAGRNVTAPLLSPEGAVCTGAAREKVADPLLAPEEAVCTNATGESTVNEPTMPSLELDPPQSRKNIGTTSITYTLTMCKDFTLNLLLQKKKNFSFFSLLNKLILLILFDSCRRKIIKWCTSYG